MKTGNEEIVLEVISNQLAIEKETILPDSLLQDDLGADSLDMVEILMGLEEAIEEDIPDEEFEECASVASLVELVGKFGGEA